MKALARPAPLIVDGWEIDLAAPVEDREGQRGWVLVEVKLRLSADHVWAWASRVGSEGFREALRRAGVEGPVWVYIYGLRVTREAEEAAEQAAMGLLWPRGELREPVKIL